METPTSLEADSGPIRSSFLFLLIIIEVYVKVNAISIVVHVTDEIPVKILDSLCSRANPRSIIQMPLKENIGSLQIKKRLGRKLIFELMPTHAGTSFFAPECACVSIVDSTWIQP